MSTLETRQHVQVTQINGEGRYQICEDPNDIDRSGYYFSNLRGNYSITGDPFALPTKLIEHLNSTFPEMQKVIFKPGSFFEGSMSAVELNYIDFKIEHDLYSGSGGYLNFDGHVCWLACSRERKSKHVQSDRFSISIEDRGSLRVVKNRLEFAETIRDGNLHVFTSGNTAFGKYRGRMTGSIDISGNRPGELIAASIEFTRQFVKEQDYPIWKKL